VCVVPIEFFGGFDGEYDLAAIQDEYREAVQHAAREIVPSLVIDETGMVFVDVEDADVAGELDLAAVAEGVGYADIVDRNHRH
jgi:hypothetical protein